MDRLPLQMDARLTLITFKASSEQKTMVTSGRASTDFTRGLRGAIAAEGASR